MLDTFHALNLSDFSSASSQAKLSASKGSCDYIWPTWIIQATLPIGGERGGALCVCVSCAMQYDGSTGTFFHDRYGSGLG